MSRDEQDASGLNGGFILEPFGRNTAPAVAIAAHVVQQRFGKDTIMLVLAADHLIQNQAAFNTAVQSAVALAEQDHLVTFGIVPTAPETGFGYIQHGDIVGAGFKVRRFVEKPDLATATGYLESGDFFWNSGMFCFKAGLFLRNWLAMRRTLLMALLPAGRACNTQKIRMRWRSLLRRLPKSLICRLIML